MRGLDTWKSCPDAGNEQKWQCGSCVGWANRMRLHLALAMRFHILRRKVLGWIGPVINWLAAMSPRESAFRIEDCSTRSRHGGKKKTAVLASWSLRNTRWG